MKKLLFIFILLPQLAWSAFPTGWGRTVALVIESDEVDADQTNYVLYLSEVNFPSEAFGASGANQALEGGGDVRFSTDASGTTRIACEIVTWDSVNSTCQVYVLVPSVSSSTDQTIYAWYNKAAESQPAIDAAYGSEAVWVDYAAVYHHEEDPSAADMNDETANDNDLVDAGGMQTGDLITGKIGSATNFNGDNNDILSSSLDVSLKNLGDMTLSGWYQPPSVGAGAIFFNEHGVGETEVDNGSILFTSDVSALDVKYIHEYGSESTNEVNSWTGFNATASAWNYYNVVRDVSTNEVDVYLAGVVVTSTFSYTEDHTLSSTTSQISMGKRVNNANQSDLQNDETRLRFDEFSANDIATEFNNQNAPATFVIEGTPSDVGGGGGEPDSGGRRRNKVLRKLGEIQNEKDILAVVINSLYSSTNK